MPQRVTDPPAPVSIRTATPSSVRAVNRSIMLELIRRHQPVSRADLARLTGVFRSSVSDIVDELLGENLITEERQSFQRGRGRVPMNLSLNDDCWQVLGLNIRPTYCQIANSGLSGQIRQSMTFQTPRSPRKLVEAVSRTIRKLCGQSGRLNQVYGQIGIAIPGHVDAARGEILWAPTHTELSHFPIGQEIEKETGIPALADNDCNLGALSELWLSTRETAIQNSDFVFLNVSDFGVGAGVVLKGEIYLGHDAHFAAEVGHMVVEPAGWICRCGRRGCWEMYVSNHATWQRWRPGSPFSGQAFEEMLASARNDDGQALQSLRETARYLSLGISNVGFLFNPREVVVAGRITAVWDLMKEEMRSHYRSEHLPYTLRPARLSADDSLLHGAICLALRKTFTGPKFGQN